MAPTAGKLATGDDDGAVKLYKFPCLNKDVNWFNEKSKNALFICQNLYIKLNYFFCFSQNIWIIMDIRQI